jgi:hypothetical protein
MSFVKMMKKERHVHKTAALHFQWITSCCIQSTVNHIQQIAGNIQEVKAGSIRFQKLRLPDFMTVGT